MQIINKIIIASLLLCAQNNTFGMLFDKYEKTGALNKGNIFLALKLTNLSLDISSEAFQAFQEGQLSKFDAAAGDQLCQVRAHHVLSLHKKKAHLASLIDKLQPEIAQAKQGLQSLESRVSESVSSRNKATQMLMNALKQKKLSEFLNSEMFLPEEKVQMPVIGPELQFLALNFFITKHYSDIGNSGEALIAQLAASKGLSTHQAKDLMVNAKGTLNEITLNYLEDLGVKMGHENAELFGFPQSSFALLLKQKVKQRQLTSPATFAGLLVLFKKLLDKGNALVLKCKVICDHGIHEVNVLFQPSEGIFEYIGELAFANLHETQAFVVEGIADPTRKCDHLHVDDLDEFLAQQHLHNGQCHILEKAGDTIKQRNILEIILANAAQHDQFLDHKTELDFTQVPDLQKKFNELKQLALDEGMCKENATIFRITHIFPATIHELLHKDINQ